MMKRSNFILFALILALGSCAEKKTVVKTISIHVESTDWVSNGVPAGDPSNGYQYSVAVPELTEYAVTNGQISLFQVYPATNSYTALPISYVSGVNTFLFLGYSYEPGTLYISWRDSDLDTAAPGTDNYKLTITVEE
jgi:hypothetical protein